MRDFDPTAGEFAGHDCIYATSRRYDIGSIVGAVAPSVIGGLFGDDAADTQAASGAASIAEQRRQFDLAREDQAPYRKAGGQAVNRLSQMLGLGGTMNPAYSGMTEAQIRAELLPQFTQKNTSPFPAYAPYGYANDSESAVTTHPGTGADAFEQWISQGGNSGANQPGTSVDETALAAAIRERMNQQPTSNTVAGQYDFTTDPSYEFRFNEGQKAVNNSLAGRGSFLSGAALKAIQKYGQGAASQEYGAQFNRLSGLAGTGQTSVQNTNALGANAAQGIGNSLEGIGNVNAAASNNWGNLINQGFQNYNQQNQLGKLLKQDDYGLRSNDQLWKQMNGY